MNSLDLSPDKNEFENAFQFLKDKRSVLFSRITLFAVILSLVHVVEDSFAGEVLIPIINSVISIFIATCYWWNKKGYYSQAVMMFLLFLNIGFFFYSLILPPNDGLYLFYFPLIVLAVVLHGKEHKGRRVFFLILSITMLVILFSIGFSVDGINKFHPKYTHFSFLMNLFSSLIIMFFCVNFMLKLNEKAESILDDITKELKSKNKSLQKANEELDRFLYSTSHDMRSPLLSIKGLINLSLAEENREVIYSYLNRMNGRIDWLDNFVTEIMDYSRNLKSEVVNEKVSLSEMIIEAVDGLRFIDTSQRIKFILNLEVEYVYSDRRRVEIVIYNIISNAIKYHDFEKSEPWIEITTQKDRNGWSLIVSDNGLGIEQEYIDQIFNMFFRGTEKSTGSGLGLYIAKEIMNKLEGNISVTSTKKKGTVFHLQFINLNTNKAVVKVPQSAKEMAFS